MVETSGRQTDEARRVLLAFVASQILPREAALRHWLLKLGVKADELDDVVQEVYYRLLRLSSVDHIAEPGAYLYRTARNVVLEQVRRAKVVPITTVQNIDDLGIADLGPTPENATVTRAELSRVLGLIAALPDRCRRVFELRKIDGLSQAETARTLDVSENVVEKETAKGLSLILNNLARGGYSQPQCKPRNMPGQDRESAHVRD